MTPESFRTLADKESLTIEGNTSVTCLFADWLKSLKACCQQFLKTPIKTLREGLKIFLMWATAGAW